jgi:hypothetical protein
MVLITACSEAELEATIEYDDTPQDEPEEPQIENAEDSAEAELEAGYIDEDEESDIGEVY